MKFVKEFVYLGQVVTREPNHKTEVTRKIKLRWSTFGKYFQMITGRLPLPSRER